MITLLAALALSQDPDFGFPVASFREVSDRMVGQLSVAKTSRTRGYLLSSDGKAVFDVNDDKVNVYHLDDGYISYAKFYVRKGDPKSALYNELQRRVAQGENGKDEDWEQVEVATLIRSDSMSSLTLAYNRDGGNGCGVVTVNLESNAVADNKSLFVGGDKQKIYSLFPDVGSNEAIMDTIIDEADRDQRSFYALLDGKKLRQTRPGWAPMLLDNKNNRFYSYLYSESGFPFAVNIEPVVGTPKDERIGFPEGCMLYMFAMLPTHQLIGYFAPRDEDGKDKLAGTYVYDQASKKWNKANSFELSGTSADGQALLFSDRVYRKSWVVIPKTPNWSTGHRQH